MGTPDGQDSPNMPVDPGLWAHAEQINASFNDLTQKLVRLHKEALALFTTGDREAMFQVKINIMQSLHEVLIDEDQTDLVFQYIMFLIGVATTYQQRDLEIGQHVNEAASAIASIGEHLGLVPLKTESSIDMAQQHADYVTGAGQRLFNVHEAGSCEGWCVIHKPIPGPWEHWPTVWREPDLFSSWAGFQRVCLHGIGHPVMEEVLSGRDGEHDCCGVCPCRPPAATPFYNETTGELEGYR